MNDLSYLLLADMLRIHVDSYDEHSR